VVFIKQYLVPNTTGQMSLSIITFYPLLEMKERNVFRILINKPTLAKMPE